MLRFCIWFSCHQGPILWASQVGSVVVMNWPADAGDAGSIPGLGRSLGVGNGNPLHKQRSLVGYSLWCQSRTWLSTQMSATAPPFHRRGSGDIGRLTHSPWVSLFIISWFKDRHSLMICLLQWNISSMKLGTIHVSFPGVPSTTGTWGVYKYLQNDWKKKRVLTNTH